MNNSEIVAYEIGIEVPTDHFVTKKQNFTTNKNYIGHTSNGIPVYLNNKLKNKETKPIMKTEIKELIPGNYDAIVEQVYTKTKEETLQKYLVVELDVNTKPLPQRQYVTFFLEGYSEKAIEISQKKINELLERFRIEKIEDLTGKQVTLAVKKNDAGYTNMFIYEPVVRPQWKNPCELPCKVVKFYESKDATKYFLLCDIDVFNGQTVTDVVCYRKNNEFDVKNFNNWLKNANLTLESMGKDIGVDCIFKVTKSPSKNDPSVIFTNKNVKFASNKQLPKVSHWTK